MVRPAANMDETEEMENTMRDAVEGEVEVEAQPRPPAEAASFLLCDVIEEGAWPLRAKAASAPRPVGGDTHWSSCITPLLRALLLFLSPPQTLSPSPFPSLHSMCTTMSVVHCFAL